MHVLDIQECHLNSGQKDASALTIQFPILFLTSENKLFSILGNGPKKIHWKNLIFIYAYTKYAIYNQKCIWSIYYNRSMHCASICKQI